MVGWKLTNWGSAMDWYKKLKHESQVTNSLALINVSWEKNGTRDRDE